MVGSRGAMAVHVNAVARQAARPAACTHCNPRNPKPRRLLTQPGGQPPPHDARQRAAAAPGTPARALARAGVTCRLLPPPPGGLHPQQQGQQHEVSQAQEGEGTVIQKQAVALQVGGWGRVCG